ncbi:MAG: hypothetical protein A2509_03610 [Candidatus Edwardsbacteria bacterium RIFOXYD12_FULL_50_11]|uniref:Uncharacterized protein n=1 Tax=Candidatus Edwardsbacteria bacterium GWF2_54_11 TaxID=1817851 RepID=A0A1F5R7S6_9BACT|nr:MAG: hypothetical protein A2502_03525 [Candidatus Edwardsbacteria bacterium RifOxyC12_full_54_24]OGF07783.1 MAG: hypothetical protein A2273_04775 [Candidatus Edwardsbacteria bacterium RifOxyA12_full_54_48]OGF10031.1 MAG: hypothetical protein A3K15_11185 [Candidatus Edwardsbacteria bacterium GWE2_54_12]OGF10500.1 MAG: hypothetical protein A2024_09125 [Candidatus Edwardsbacteria bacterium GWF2_54_11]OGF14943.1 MAG: hypothetical protein A2509_03610 [Candidatus Edwardsbacteria bacterium RIFOXYD1
MSPAIVDNNFRDDLYQLLKAIELKRILSKADSNLEILASDVSLEHISLGDLITGVASDYGIEIAEVIPSGYISGPNDDGPMEFVPDGGIEKYIVNIQPGKFNSGLDDINKDYEFRHNPPPPESAVQLNIPEQEIINNPPYHPLSIGEYGNIYYDKEIIITGQQLKRLCSYLMRHHGRTCSSLDLYRTIIDNHTTDCIRGIDGVEKLSRKQIRLLYTHIHSLSKLLDNRFGREVVFTKHKIGYQLKCDNI